MLSSRAESMTVVHAINLMRKNSLISFHSSVLIDYGRTYIQNMFNCLMKGYPLESMVFWKWQQPELELEEDDCFSLYNFLDSCSFCKDRKDPQSLDFSVLQADDCYVVIVGSDCIWYLVLGLCGSYEVESTTSTEKHLLTKTKLYLNLTSKLDYLDSFDFRFLSDEDLKDTKFKGFMRVGEILNQEFTDVDDARLDGLFDQYLRREGFTQEHGLTFEQADFAKKTLQRLYKSVHVNTPILYRIEQTHSNSRLFQLMSNTYITQLTCP